MQTHATKPNLRPNCLLKMSFQGHENKPSSKATDKTTADPKTSTVSNMPHSLLGLTTFGLALTGSNSFDSYNIPAWNPKRFCAISKKNQDGFVQSSASSSNRNPQVRTHRQLMPPHLLSHSTR